MRLGQEESKGAALGERAGQADLAPKQTRDFRADSKTQTGAAIVAARTALSFMDRLKDNLLSSRGNADASVAHGERDHRAGMIQRLVVGPPTFLDRGDAENHLAFFREFERV